MTVGKLLWVCEIYVIACVLPQKNIMKKIPTSLHFSILILKIVVRKITHFIICRRENNGSN